MAGGSIDRRRWAGVVVAVWGALLDGCTSEVLVARRDADTDTPSLACADPVVLARGEVLVLDGAVPFDGGVAASWADGADRWVATLDAEGRPLARSALGSRARYVRLRIVGERGVLHAVAHNHELRGQWHVYYEALAGAGDPWAWDEALQVSVGSPEAQDAHVAVLGDRTAVAYRQGLQVAVATFAADGRVVGRAALPGSLPLPFLHGVAPHGDGLAVLYARGGGWTVEAFGPDALGRGTVDGFAAEAAAFVGQEGEAVAVGTDTSLELRPLDPAAETPRRVVGTPAAVTAVAATNLVDSNRETTLIAAAYDDGRARLVALDGDRARVAPLAERGVDTVAAVAAGQAVVVLWVEAGPERTLFAQRHCP